MARIDNLTGYQGDFIKMIKGACYAVYRYYGVLPSVCCGQAIWESGWGRSAPANNLFGIKGSGSSQTTQEWVNGQYITITDSFQAYKNMGECFAGYGNLLKNGTYQGPKKITEGRNYLEQLERIQTPPQYATAPTYVANISGLIRNYEIYKWDEDAKAGGNGGGFDFDFSTMTGAGIGGSNVGQHKNYSEDLLKTGIKARPGGELKSVQAIVIHDIQNSGSVQTVKNALNGGNGGSNMGYHFIIGEKEALQIVPTNEKVHHAERAASLVAGMSKPNDATLSIGIITSNVSNKFSTKLNVKAALVLAEICRNMKIPATAIQPAWRIDGVKEPVNWYNNTFYYTAFISMVADAIEQGDAVITNPNYNPGGSSGVGGDGLIPGGSGIIPDMLKEAKSLERTISYSQSDRNRVYAGGSADCSSFCQAMFLRHAKIDVGSWTGAQFEEAKIGKRINNINELRAGDLIFFGSTDSSRPGRSSSHVGLVGEDGNMIDHGGPDKGPKIRSYLSTYWKGKFIGGMRYFSDNEYNQSQEKPTDNKPTIDPNGSYVVQINKPMNATNAASGGVSMKRLAPGEVYRVKQISSASIQLENELWIPKMTESASFVKMGTTATPIGNLLAKNTISVYEQPSLLAAPIIEQEAPKRIETNSSTPIYALENNFAQVQVGESPQWALAGASYAEITMTLPKGSSTDEVNFEQGVPVSLVIEAREISNDYVNENGYPTSNRAGIIAHKDLLPIGSIINVEVPLLSDYSKKYVVISNELTAKDGNRLQLVFTSKVQAYNFGQRESKVLLEKTVSEDVIREILAAGGVEEYERLNDNLDG